MTLLQRYSDLAIPLELFGIVHPAPLKEITIESLQGYAKGCIESNLPMLKSIGYEINYNICISGYNINGEI